MRCGLIHLLSEVVCLMMFGQLPPYFWRKNTPVEQRVKEHYKKTRTRLYHWQQTGDTRYTAMRDMLFHLFVKPYESYVADRMRKELAIERKRVEDKPKEKKEIDPIILEALKRSVSKSRIEALNELETNNGEEKKEPSC
jgi:hypothetical protein